MTVYKPILPTKHPTPSAPKPKLNVVIPPHHQAAFLRKHAQRPAPHARRWHSFRNTY
ncbi:hypothetical protein S101106_01870 [Levilactobacillus brevis]|jgi:hypothetical protein|nr:hypothetical protein S101174_01906 [Levilactobacillus brevis]ARW51325.1 hypothetical protein S101106_01870 [Levilactobacillus brevis]